MNPKVVKLKEERAKNCEKISSLQARNKKIDADILYIENTDIIGMVREVGLSPDALAEFLAALKRNPVTQPKLSEETEDATLEEQRKKAVSRSGSCALHCVIWSSGKMTDKQSMTEPKLLSLLPKAPFLQALFHSVSGTRSSD